MHRWLVLEIIYVHNRVFTKHTFLPPLYTDVAVADNELPTESELAGISPKLKVLFYFQWLSDRATIDISLSYLELLVDGGSDILSQDGNHKINPLI